MNAFQLVDAQSIDEAVALLQRHGPVAQPIAAGGDLLGLLKDGVRGPALPAPSILVNLSTARELARVDREADGWSFGALSTLDRLARTPGVPPMLVDAIAHVASPQIRARTTLGGNLLQRPRCLYFRHPDETCFKKGGVGCPARGGPVQAYPGSLLPGACHAGHPSDLAPVLIALDAGAELRGPSGTRFVRLADFYRDAPSRVNTEADILAGEVLVRVQVPGAEVAQAFEKIAPRDANEFATASAAAAGVVVGGRWQMLRIALAGVAPGPLVVRTDALIGQAVHAVADDELARRVLPSRSKDPLGARWPAACLAIERVVRRIRTEAETAANR